MQKIYFAWYVVFCIVKIKFSKLSVILSENILFLFYYVFMSFLCRFIFLFFIFIVTLSANAFCDGDFYIVSKSTDTISAVQVYNQDILTAKNDESIQSFQKNDGFVLNNRKSDNSYDGNLNKILFGNKSQFQGLLAYIYNQSFLHNKSKVHFSVILSEIFPNAP